MGRRHQQPAFARLGLSDGLGKNRVLDGIARAILERDARARDAEAFQQAQRQGGLRALVIEERAAAAREHDAGVGVAPRQLGHHGETFGRLVERDLVARGGNVGRDRPAEHDNAVGRSARRVPAWEALLQRDDQRIADRGEAEDREHHEAREGERPPGARKARRQQQQPEHADRNDEVGRDGEEAEDLGEGKEHPPITSSSTPRSAPWCRRSWDRGREAWPRARPRRR